ncbi:MAG: hypothetical protein SVU69_01690 [Pseudomonadota bacterium]|nr:hypothetical protein [Pseudomonadota bacterium]
MKLKLLCLAGLLALAPMTSQAAMIEMDSAELAQTAGQFNLNLWKLFDLGKPGAGIVLPGKGPFVIPPGQNPFYGAPGQSLLFRFIVHHKGL